MYAKPDEKRSNWFARKTQESATSSQSLAEFRIRLSRAYTSLPPETYITFSIFIRGTGRGAGSHFPKLFFISNFFFSSLTFSTQQFTFANFATRIKTTWKHGKSRSGSLLRNQVRLIITDFFNRRKERVEKCLPAESCTGCHRLNSFNFPGMHCEKFKLQNKRRHVPLHFLRSNLFREIFLSTRKNKNFIGKCS